MAYVRRVSIQRVIDAVVALSLTVAGVAMVVGFKAPPGVSTVLRDYGVMLWAMLLAASAFTALLGAVLRTEHFGRRQAVAFAFDLVGWSFCSAAVLIYAASNIFTDGNVAGVAALVALGVSLGGKYLRRLAAMRAVRAVRHR